MTDVLGNSKISHGGGSLFSNQIIPQVPPLPPQNKYTLKGVLRGTLDLDPSDDS